MIISIFAPLIVILSWGVQGFHVIVKKSSISPLKVRSINPDEPEIYGFVRGYTDKSVQLEVNNKVDSLKEFIKQEINEVKEDNKSLNDDVKESIKSLKDELKSFSDLKVYFSVGIAFASLAGLATFKDIGKFLSTFFSN